jgi:hypothetical protein
MVKEPSHVKQLSLNHLCKIELIWHHMKIYLLFIAGVVFKL